MASLFPLRLSGSWTFRLLLTGLLGTAIPANSQSPEQIPEVMKKALAQYQESAAKSLLGTTQVDFGAVKVGEPSIQDLSLKNVWSHKITCEINTPGTIAASVGSIEIPAGQEKSISLTFRAMQAGVFADSVQFRCIMDRLLASEEPFTVSVATRAVSSAGPVDSRQEIPDVYWNTWITDQTTPPREVTGIEEKKRYTVFFDLSPYLYKRPSSLVAGVRAGRLLAEALKATPGDSLELLVYPVVAGNALELSKKAPESVEVDLKRFREPAQRTEVPSSAVEFARFAGAATVRGLQIPGIPIDILTKKAGCASVGLSIWRQTDNGQEPLDYISRGVAVADAAGRVPDCPSVESATLAGLPVLLSSGIERRADAAIHVFQMSSDDDLVLYVTPSEHHFWTAGERMETLLKGSSALPRNLYRAHQGEGYAKTMERLTTALFPLDQSEAEAALRSIRGLTALKQRPVVFARLVKPNGKLTILPLGLIDDGAGHPLGEKIDFVEALPREEPGSSECVSTVTLAMPPELLDLCISQCRAPKPSAIDYATWEKFFPYLKDMTRPTKPEGLLLLAHQAGGSISFTPPDMKDENFARPNNFYRTYSAGSVAAMVVCNAASPEDGESPDWLAKLNEQGISASIASPFTIPANYGACFTMHLAEQIQIARKSLAPITVLELHRRVVAKMAEDLEASPLTRSMVPLLQEFLVTGDPGVRICNH